MLNRMARPALTPHTLTTITSIMKEIEFVGRHGYAIIDEELEIGIRSIAVPIRNARGEMVAAMSLSVSTSRMTREGVVEHLLPELESARRHLAALL